MSALLALGEEKGEIILPHIDRIEIKQRISG
jgi:hypothetical protein